MPLTRVELDQTTCQKPDCGHTGDQHVMVVRGRCHPHAGVSCELHEDVVHVRCCACQKFVVDVRVDLPPDTAPSLAPTCHTQAPVSCAYSQGHLHLRCALCEAQVATLPVHAGTCH